MNKEIKESFVEGLIETGKDFAKEQLGELIPKVVSESSFNWTRSGGHGYRNGSICRTYSIKLFYKKKNKK
ncbi:hypothetical protein QK911_13590 [Lactococcus lactis]